MYYSDANHRFFPSNTNDYSVIPNEADEGGVMRNLFNLIRELIKMCIKSSPADREGWLKARVGMC
jgi:hypothetical protein